MLLSEAEDNNCGRRQGGRSWCLAQSKTLCTWRSSLDGTWEISALSGVASRERAAKVNTAKLPRTVLRSRTTSYYRRSKRTMAPAGLRSLWREGR